MTLACNSWPLCQPHDKFCENCDIPNKAFTDEFYCAVLALPLDFAWMWKRTRSAHVTIVKLKYEDVIGLQFIQVFNITD